MYSLRVSPPHQRKILGAPMGYSVKMYNNINFKDIKFYGA
jgi:hypothetical protein